MQNNIRNTNLRFNLDKEQQRRAWEYLQTMDRQDFKSYSQVCVADIVLHDLSPPFQAHISQRFITFGGGTDVINDGDS